MPPPVKLPRLSWQLIVAATTAPVLLTNSSIFFKRAHQSPFFTFHFFESTQRLKFSEQFHEKNVGRGLKKCVFSFSLVTYICRALIFFHCLNKATVFLFMHKNFEERVYFFESGEILHPFCALFWCESFRMTYFTSKLAWGKGKRTNYFFCFWKWGKKTFKLLSCRLCMHWDLNIYEEKILDNLKERRWK